MFGAVRTASVVLSLGWVLLGVGCGGRAKGPADSGPPDGGETPDGDAGGGADVAPRAFPADEINGTRLRARYWQTEDGQRFPQASGGDTPVWFDTKLGTPCVWQPSPDPATGTSHACWPYNAYGVQPDLFADAECKIPVRVARSNFYTWAANEAAVPSATSGQLPFGPPWGSNELQRETSCAEKAYGADGDDVVELGAPLAAATYYALRGDCTAIALAPGEVVRSVGRKLALSELATARVERDDTGHRLSTRQLVSADGARQRIGWYDNALGLACTVGVAADGKRRCLPEDAHGGQASFIYFTDAAGGQLALITAETNPYEPGSTFRTSGETLACGQTRSKVYRVGATYSGEIHAPGDPTPLPKDLVPAGIYVHVTEIAAESMDAFEPRTLGGRLQITALVDAEGALDVFPFGATPFGGTLARFAENLTDSSLLQPCRFQHLKDGSIRCLPTWSAQIAGLNCTRNVVVNMRPFTMCPGDPASTFTAVWRGDACTGGYEVSSLGKMIVPNSGAVGDCNVFGGDGTTYYEIGPATPPVTFAAGTITTD